MILAFDTFYFDNKAKTVCLSFDTWTESENFKVYSEILENIEDYTSGEFYKRELPCILSLLKTIDSSEVEVIIVDSFVFLDDDNKLGLGGHLYEKLDSTIPVIGVAKNNFATIDKLKKALLRGESTKPLFITSIGIDLDLATSYIKSMAGTFRIPTLLKHLDTLTKENCG
jgi:deoxyribonuclease V